jgi:hypothetical protein
MGLIKRRFKITNAAKQSVFTNALVDTGADVTNINLNTACDLGLNPKTAKKSFQHVPGGVLVTGFELHDVHIQFRLRNVNRHATLPRVFVPTETEIVDANGQLHITTVPRNEEQLIGHDFLQASGAQLDFAKDELQGRPPRTLQRGPLRPATPAQRARLSSLILCKVPAKKTKRR